MQASNEAAELNCNAIRERVALAAAQRRVSPVPFILLSDDEINEGAGFDWIAENLMGVSLDWLILGEPVQLADRLTEYDSPLRAAVDLMMILRCAALGGIDEYNGGRDAIGRVTDMASDLLHQAMNDLRAVDRRKRYPGRLPLPAGKA